MTEIKVDQVWEDRDPRGPRRQIKIIMIEGDVATCENTRSARHTRVKISRFKTDYKLVSL